MISNVVYILQVVFFIRPALGVRYEPNWKSLDSRPLPAWYDEAKFGIFIHWGVFSVPAWGSEWFWERWQGQKRPDYIKWMKDNYRPDFTYADFAPQFRAQFYDPVSWAKTLKQSGAKYVVLVSKHHEGFTNWPSKYSFNWNAGDVGPKRDLVGDLAKAVREHTDIKFGLYHSMYEWFNPLCIQDEANNFSTQRFVKEKTLPELYEIVKRYKPEVVWSDGDWIANDTYWDSTQYLSWLFSDSPVKDTVVVNDRWGKNTNCKHGSFWNCHDHYQPGKLVPHKWENCMKIDYRSWGFREDAPIRQFQTAKKIIDELVTTVSLGGNLLLNVGPTASGVISPIFQERLLQVGSWLKVNGEAIYKTRVWSHQNDSLAKDVWYTSKHRESQIDVYAILLEWPHKGHVTLGFPIPSSSTVITLLGYGSQLEYKAVPGGGVKVELPAIPISEMPCEWAWVLKMTKLKNQETKLDWKSFSREVQSIRMEPDSD